MSYNLKNKINVTEEFISELISSSWQETENIQQQIANINTDTKLGAEVARLLKNACTNYYILIGCLEQLAENSGIAVTNTDIEPESVQKVAEPDHCDLPAELCTAQATNTIDFEPFEYFVDFDEPSGTPLSDQDLYG